MAIERRKFQGVFNILRFNWDFYLTAFLASTVLLWIAPHFNSKLGIVIYSLLSIVLLITLLSLIVSWYVYDLSGLYKLSFLPEMKNKKACSINAGFDEISQSIFQKYPGISLTVFDFYDATKHTEKSIKRARRVYPPLMEIIKINSTNIPTESNIMDVSIAFFSAHEIRDENERIIFFKELKRITKTEGEIYLVEHLRDLPNFIAYTLGFFHFHSKKTWFKTFKSADLELLEIKKHTPFVNIFILK